MSKIIIKHAPELVTCRGFAPKRGKDMSDVGMIKDGAVVIVDDTIEFIGTTEELEVTYLDQSDYEIVDATGHAVIPGFVDSHTHFVFGGYRADEFGWRLRGDSYMSIMERGGGIASSVTATKNATDEELYNAGLERLNRMMSYGVTTVEGKSGYGLDKDTELRMLRVMKQLNEDHPMDIVTTFLGPHATPTEYKGRNMDFLKFNLEEVMPQVIEEGLAEFADIFTEKNVFEIDESRYYLEEAKKLGFKLKMHADEIVDIEGSALAVEVGCTSADHLLMANDESIKKMANSKIVSTLLPATAFSLAAPYAKGREMIDAGCAVAIASDYNPGSCHTCSIPLLIALSCIYMHLSVEEVITGLTINGAAALHRDDTVGSIEIGKKADLIMLQHPSIQFLPYCAGMNIVDKVMKNGKFI